MTMTPEREENEAFMQDMANCLQFSMAIFTAGDEAIDDPTISEISEKIIREQFIIFLPTKESDQTVSETFDLVVNVVAKYGYCSCSVWTVAHYVHHLLFLEDVEKVTIN